MPDASFPFDDLVHIDLAGIDLAGTVVVLVAEQAQTKAGDHRLLAALVGRLTGADAASVTLCQQCPSCGESGHGPLRVLVDAAAPSHAVHVSLARAGGLVALAVTAAGPVGIDLESVAALRHAPVGDALLSAAEARAMAAVGAPDAEAATGVIWTSKEAVLKAAGVGLRVDPRDLTVVLPAPGGPPTGHDAAPSPSRNARWPVLATWPSAPFPLDAVHLHPLAGPTGTVGTVAVVCAARPALMFLSELPQNALSR